MDDELAELIANFRVTANHNEIIVVDELILVDTI